MQLPSLVFFWLLLALDAFMDVCTVVYSANFSVGRISNFFSLSQCFGLCYQGYLFEWLANRHFWNRPFRIVSSLTYASALAFCALWFVNRHNPRAYLALDCINMCLCIYAIRSSNIRSLRLLTFLLSAMFAYDLFMVFGTRLFFDGCSVMLEVVTGVDCASAKSVNTQDALYPTPPVDGTLPEKIPLLFYVPLLSDPMGECFDINVEVEYRHIMLGLGDVIIPGYFVAFCFWLDKARNKGRITYRSIALIGYALGLVTTFIALKVMKTGQPALLYLVPFTLIPISVYAWKDGTLGSLWSGENDISDNNRKGNTNNQSNQNEAV